MSEGELGISLGQSPSAPSGLTLTGDLQPLDQDPNTAGIQLGYDSLGNVIVGSETDPGREDTLFDDSGNDLLQGFGGSDLLPANRGGDNLSTPTGNKTSRPCTIKAKPRSAAVSAATCCTATAV